MEGERKGTLGRSRGTWGKHPRATETNDGEAVRCARNVARVDVGATTMERERNCGREKCARERVAAKGSSIRIPRHAPSYHIDLAIVTILSSPAMLGCTIAAGGRGMPKSEESRGGGSEGRRGWRLRGRGSRVVPHGVPRHPDARMWAAEGLNARARARNRAALLDEEKRGVVAEGAEGICDENKSELEGVSGRTREVGGLRETDGRRR